MRVDLEEFLADEGLRTGSRRMALYMKEIFGAPDEVPAAPAAETGGLPLAVRVREDSEELNFDRRAPLSLRLEASTAEEPVGARLRAPIPTEDAPPVVAAPVPPAKRNGVGRSHEVPAAPAPTPAPPAPPVLRPAAAPAAPADDPGVDVPAGAGKGRGWLVLLVLLAAAAALAFTVLK
jgi:hypothetical protein